MHELSIVESLIEQVHREVAGAGHSGRIVQLDLVIGRFSGVSAECLRFAFEVLAPGTPLEAAQLQITEPGAICRCDDCGAQAEIDELAACCPRCGSGRIAIEGGQELLLQSIELEEDVTAC